MAVLRQGRCAARRPPHQDQAPALPLRIGDIALRLLAAPGSIGLACASLSGYSHCGVVNRQNGQLVIDDCYPARDSHPGGRRRTLWSSWIRREGNTPVLQWQVLRHPGIDPDRAAQRLAQMAENPFGYTLLTDQPRPLSPGDVARINCSTFVQAFLKDQNVDCRPGLALTRVTWRVVRTFLRLARQRFYERLPGGAGRDYYALAKDYGLTAVTHCPTSTLQPGFCELLPAFHPVAYGQNPAIPPTVRHFALRLYRTTIPEVRAALACHGLPAARAKSWLTARRYRALAQLARGTGNPINGTQLAVDGLLQKAMTPMPYLTIPLATQAAFSPTGAMGHLLWTALLAVAPALASLAGRAGLKPFDRLPPLDSKV